MAFLPVNEFSRCSYIVPALKKLSITNPFKLPYRNTFILKRRIPVARQPDKKTPVLVEDNYIYDLVEDQNMKKKPFINVLLTEFVEDIGQCGQIVSVHPSFAYSYLILPGRAVYPTPENIAKQKLLKDEDLEKHSSLMAYKTMKMLNQTVVPILMHMRNPWTIEPWHVRVAFRKNGIHVLNDKSIELPENPIIGPNLELEGRLFAVTITINNLEKATVRCRLQHWTEKFSDRIALSKVVNEKISEPIFPEQKELLMSLPPCQESNE